MVSLVSWGTPYIEPFLTIRLYMYTASELHSHGTFDKSDNDIQQYQVF